MILPPVVIAFKLVTPGIDARDCQMVLTGADYLQQNTYDQMKRALRKPHSQQVILNPSLQGRTIKLEPLY